MSTVLDATDGALLYLGIWAACGLIVATMVAVLAHRVRTDERRAAVDEAAQAHGSSSVRYGPSPAEMRSRDRMAAREERLVAELRESLDLGAL